MVLAQRASGKPDENQLKLVLVRGPGESFPKLTSSLPRRPTPPSCPPPPCAF